MTTADKVAHTSGPWTVRGVDVYGAGCKVAESPSRLTTAGSTTAHKQALANARLIAAAPDLLAAAQFARSVILANGVFETSERIAVEKLDAVIAKAEGQ